MARGKKDKPGDTAKPEETQSEDTVAAVAEPRDGLPDAEADRLAADDTVIGDDSAPGEGKSPTDSGTSEVNTPESGAPESGTPESGLPEGSARPVDADTPPSGDAPADVPDVAGPPRPQDDAIAQDTAGTAAAETDAGHPENAAPEEALTGQDSVTDEALGTEPEPRRTDEMDSDRSDLASGSGDDRIGRDDDGLGTGTESPPPVVRETVVERKGGFVPMVLGGVIAAALGYGAAQFGDGRLPFLAAPEPDPFIGETRAALSRHDEQISGLEQQMADTQSAVDALDLAPLSGTLAAVEDGLAATNESVAALEDQLAAFDSRMTALEKEPLAEAVSPEAIAAYERELEELRAAIQQQRDAVDAQRAEIERMAQDALASEQNAEQQAGLAEIRAALAEVTALVQDGRPYAEPLSVVQARGVEIPAPLAAQAQEGVPTLAALADTFPDAARAALSAARSAQGEDGGGGLSAFFQNQLGARSVQPREGDDPDAVLSRAEAAVTSGDLDAALAEIERLPEGARTEMADWVARAEARRDALGAASDLARQVNQE